MKILLPLIALLLLFGACSSRDGQRRWTSSPGFDARIGAFEHACAEGVPADTLAMLTSELYARAAADSARRELRAAADYCNAHRLNLLGDRRRALFYVDRALDSMPDSAVVPRLFHRAVHLKAVVEYSLRRSAATSYRRLKECEDYYLATGDTLSLVRALNSLAKILSDAGLMDECRAYIDRIGKCYDELGYARYIYEFNLTKAWLADREGHRREADSIIRFLARDSRSRRNPRFYNAVLVSCWNIMHDTAALDSAYALRRYMHPSVLASVELEKARIAIARGDIAGAEELTSAAYGRACEISDTALLITILKARTGVEEMLGHDREVLSLVRMRDSLLESQSFSSVAANLAAEQLKMDLSLQEERASKARQRTFYIVLIICMGAFIIVGTSLTVMRHSRQQHEFKALQDKLLIEKKNRLLSLVACSLNEKESLVDSFRKIIHRACDEGKLTLANARELESSLRLYYSADEELHTLTLINETLPSDFIERLRGASAVPLPDSLVNLAMCIACGLSSKQISRLLKIQPDTVKKNRWKLRTALGVAPEESLSGRLLALIS